MAENAAAAVELTEADKKATLNKVVFSSFLGNFIEWFDYASYSYLATVIALVFFPATDHAVAVMLTFVVFAISYLVRPIGAFFWGSFGDKHGRKEALAISILLMSGSTFLIGCLPSYAMVGLLSPILLLLLRMTQAFSAAGEYAGASTFIAEYAPTDHRGFYCSMVPASTAVGLLIGSFFATGMYAIWGADSWFVVTWGWRIPFWLAGPLGYITHYIRSRLEDSPVYEKMLADMESHGEGQADMHPIKTLFTKYPKVTLIAFGTAIMNAIGFYAVLTFMPNYLETVLGYDPASASLITNIVLIVYIVFIFISGRLSDKFGRKKLLTAAAAGFVILTLPCYLMMGTMQFGVILAAELIMAFLLTLNDGTLASYLSETFPTEVRFTGFATTFNFANGFFGGSISAISLALVNATGSQLAPAFYFIFMSIIALVCIRLSKEYTGVHLDDIGAMHQDAVN